LSPSKHAETKHYVVVEQTVRPTLTDVKTSGELSVSPGAGSPIPPPSVAAYDQLLRLPERPTPETVPPTIRAVVDEATAGVGGGRSRPHL
jgi:hypothetical protein